MARILYIVVLLVFCAGISLSDAELYKWVDEDGIEHFSNSKPKVSPDTPVETEPEIPFDAAADAERQEQDNKIMEAVNLEKIKMESEDKKTEKQPVQTESLAPTVIVEDDNDNQDYSGRDYNDENPRVEDYQTREKQDEIPIIQPETNPKNAAPKKNNNRIGPQ
jgi:hypothetical protein